MCVVSSVISTLRYRNPNKSDVSLPFYPVILWKHCYENVSISNDLIMLMPVKLLSYYIFFQFNLINFFILELNENLVKHSSQPFQPG